MRIPLAMPTRHHDRNGWRTSLTWAPIWLLTALPASAAPSPVHATWTGQPIRLVADQLSQLAGRPVVLDRRIDPTTPITLVVAGEPCDSVINTIAAAADGRVIQLETVIRIAPPATVGPCLAAEQARRREAARLPRLQRETLASQAPWGWPAGSRPRELVAAAAAEAGLTIEGMDQIPHDHFPAAELPPLALSERLDLILAHFDLRVAWSAGQSGTKPRGQIVPLPDATPSSDVEPPSMPPPPRQPRSPSSGGRQAYTLRLEAPLEEALAAVCRQLGLRLDLDAASLSARGIAPREIARANVQSASRDKLLDAILVPLGLSWRIDDGVLRVWAAPQP